MVSILDFLGNKVFEKTISNQNLFSLDLSTLKKGLYLVIINNNQEIYSSKFILE
ncbi:T9SS type A sorting domain-containing protein [Arcicella aquatica]|uniref:T9SS type A sorting domain-containing protein n=1 Tax=Arcicella aquatica TaxID=217141 RepID=UPI0038995369